MHDYFYNMIKKQLIYKKEKVSHNLQKCTTQREKKPDWGMDFSRQDICCWKTHRKT